MAGQPHLTEPRRIISDPCRKLPRVLSVICRLRPTFDLNELLQDATRFGEQLKESDGMCLLWSYVMYAHIHLPDAERRCTVAAWSVLQCIPDSTLRPTVVHSFLDGAPCCTSPIRPRNRAHGL